MFPSGVYPNKTGHKCNIWFDGTRPKFWELYTSKVPTFANHGPTNESAQKKCGYGRKRFNKNPHIRQNPAPVGVFQLIRRILHIIFGHQLVGGLSLNPIEKYAQVKMGSSSPKLWVNIENIWNHHLVNGWLSSRIPIPVIDGWCVLSSDYFKSRMLQQHVADLALSVWSGSPKLRGNLYRHHL